MALEDKYPRDAEKAREEIVDLWLEKDPNPTWAKLADAFDHAGQRALAKKIRETYNCELKKTQFKCTHTQIRGMWNLPSCKLVHVYTIYTSRSVFGLFSRTGLNACILLRELFIDSNTRSI